ncbi:MAG: PD-(D/E)XK nuclease family protein [Acidobacteriota bacterium]|nr:PD-(D/E)XK nuclease family protein [Acidobacteriota bacterium]
MDRYTEGTLITANARLSRQLRRAYDSRRRRQGVRVWETADILPRGAWLARAWEECAYRDPFHTPVLLSSLQEEALWEQAIKNSGASSILLDPSATVTAAAQAWTLVHAWEAPCNAAEFRGLQDPEEFLDWMLAVERKLRDNDWITASELPRALLDRVASGTFAPPTLFHVGFDELTPADRRLFEACHAQPWPAPPAHPAPLQHRVGLRDTSEELIQAASWARRKLESHPDARIGIIVPGLAGLTAAAHRIFDDTFHPGLDFAGAGSGVAFHISAGLPAADVPLIASALLALGIQPGLQIGEAGMLLRSPFLRFDSWHGARLFAELRRRGVDKVSFEIDEVRRVFPGMAKAAEESRHRQHPSEWSATFSKMLREAGWPGQRPLSPTEHQTVELWKNLLSGLASLDVVLPRLTFAQALQRLRGIAHDRRFAPGDEGAPVQIIDMLEAAGSQFDALWVAGLHGGAWPGVARPNPFLPLSLQRQVGMPHSSPERELHYARRVTARLLAAAPEVICSYPLFSGEEQLRVSPLLAFLPEATEFAPPFETSLWRIFSSAVPLEQESDGQAPPLAGGILQRGGMGVLANQAACPFRAFAKYRLGASDMDAADIGISPSERGNVAHKALELFWSDVKSQRELLSQPRAEIDLVIARSVSAALAIHMSRRSPSASLDRSRALEQERLCRLLNEWLERERERPDFTVLEREQPREVAVGALKLAIKADRLDRYADGTHAILDYKTSAKQGVADWAGDRPNAPQLMLYAVKSEHAISSVEFAVLVPGSTYLDGYRGQDLHQQLPQWTDVVEHLGVSFFRGDAQVDPKYGKKSCEFCQLHSLCRIADVRAPNTPEDDFGE